jgi:cyclopropane fatty-acyl-phospholipid synthase-like methyltransferase
MAQITSGIRSIFSHPVIFDTFQALIGAPHARTIFVEEFLKMREASSLLDIGCGTAELLKHLPDTIYYVGYDVSERYIQAAKKNFGVRNAEFFARQVTETTLGAYQPFDRVTATGLVHHLEDHEAIQLFQLAKDALGDNGFFVSIDPCFVEQQSSISKFLVERDRGKNVRTLAAYKRLAESVFRHVALYHRSDLLHVPYDHAVLVCS